MDNKTFILGFKNQQNKQADKNLNMSKSIFISYVFEDSYRIDSIKKWVTDNRLGDIVITQEAEDKRQQGKEAC